MTVRTVVGVGAGHGGFQLAASLRQNGFDGRIILVDDDEGLPYQRPPLSKAYLLGKLPLDRLLIRPGSFFRDQRIELVLGTRVVRIDRAAGAIEIARGERIPYDHLVLATGARNRTLQLPGAELDGVCYLRTLRETDALKARIGAARNAVVIGAGFIGLEFAAVANACGVKVHVVELAPRVMVRSVTPDMSRFFADVHASAGIVFDFEVQPTAIIGDAGGVAAVQLSDGRTLPADLVVISVGVVPNVELAAEAGLAADNGVVVDAMLHTADPAISAVGDCVLFPSPHLHRAVRFESIQNAVDQARCVADRITGEASSEYGALPWFWSDQGAMKLQIVGVPDGLTETVIRGRPEEGAFSIFCFRNGELVAIESVNRPGEHMFGRRFLGTPGLISPAEAADRAFDLKARAAALTPAG